ncbi:hypothetical protein [Trinickia dinghuensis]|uniref:hypothetical protein n=1 Tax=Trinickia dinghuensis TaxID=2291023 RepID=UPI0015F18DE7|nr:hypothetical protein [Trinickia dinghuensis]
MAAPVFAKMVTKPVDWKLDGTTFKSVLVYDDAVAAKTGVCRYDAKAAARSYRMMHDWLAETFAEKGA